MTGKTPGSSWTVTPALCCPTSMGTSGRGSSCKAGYRLWPITSRPHAQTLIVGPGGGIDVLTALTFGNRDITGVEINPITVDEVMRGAFRDFTGGLYFRPEVQIHVDEGRSFIRRAPHSYDIIQATLVDTWAATAAGAFALTENNLYTVEAFKDYFGKLKDDGILTFTRWNLDPPQQDLRLVSLTRAAMLELGLSNPERSMIVVRESRQREAVECNFFSKNQDLRMRKCEQSKMSAARMLLRCSTLPLRGLKTPLRD